MVQNAGTSLPGMHSIRWITSLHTLDNKWLGNRYNSSFDWQSSDAISLQRKCNEHLKGVEGNPANCARTTD